MKIDLHVHSKERSSCGKATEEEQIQAAMNAGLDAIAFTDHDKLISQKRLTDLNKKYAPFRVFGGIEICIWDIFRFNYEHLLVLGIYDKRLEGGKWSYPDLYNFVRERNGFIALAHPFRYISRIGLDLEHFPPDALELYSRNTPKHKEARILSLAGRLDISILSNSDAHHVETLGKYYNRLERNPTDEYELISMLKTGEFQCVSLDSAHVET